MAAAISSRPACSRSVMIASSGCPGNNSAKACNREASSSPRRIAYSFAVRTGAASFFQRSRKGLNFTTTVWLLGMVFALLAIVLIGFVLLWILGIVNLVLVVIAAIRVSDGALYRYPFSWRLVK